MAKIHEQDGLYELTDTTDLDPSLVNEDILPTPIKQRTWNQWHIASLWVGMSVCIPTYMLASSMIIGGLSWVEALVMILLGNVIVAIPMIFNGHAGTKYGIPFPVLGRASFGYHGIQIPSVLRALVACGWFGIQTWLGGLAFVAIASVLFGNPDLMQSWPAQFSGFIVFWLINMFFVWKGTESIRVLETLAAPVLILVGIGMLVWGINNAGGLDNILKSSAEFKKPTVVLTASDSGMIGEFNLLKDADGNARAKKYRYIFTENDKLSDDEKKALTAKTYQPIPQKLTFGSEHKDKKLAIQFQGEVAGKPCKTDPNDEDESTCPESSPLVVAASTGKTNEGTSLMTYLTWLTAMVAFWATLALNIPDITRYAKSQKDQAVGQFLGLPTTMVLYSFIGVAVTCAAIIIFDDILITADAPWDPIRLIARLEDQPVLMVCAQLAILLATLSTNIAANVISPANSFANLMPTKISFKMGGYITGVVGILIMPWKLLGVIVGFLLTYGAILGPVVGILLADYFIINKKELALDELYKTKSRYSFSGGFNPLAVIALTLGIVIVLLGLFVPAMKPLYDTGWFVGFFISFLVYVIGMKATHKAIET